MLIWYFLSNASSAQWVIGNSSCTRISCWISSLWVLTEEVHLWPTFDTGEGLSFPSKRNVDVVAFIELGPASLELVIFLSASLSSRVLILFSGSKPSKFIRMLQFLNVATISHRTFIHPSAALSASYHWQCGEGPTMASFWRSLWLETASSIWRRWKSRHPGPQRQVWQLHNHGLGQEHCNWGPASAGISK